MKNFPQSVTQPVTGREAHRLLKALKSGGVVTSSKYEALIDRIMNGRAKKDGNVKKLPTSDATSKKSVRKR